MTLRQLADAANAALQYERNPDGIEVVITTELPFATCGQRPCTGVKCVGMGFDWEAGQFRITPEEKLMCRKYDGPISVKEWRGWYHCPKCEKTLAANCKKPDIHFCSECGQAVKWE